MDKKSKEQVHLCLNEMLMVKQLLDLKVSDDFCSRLLGIYVLMRVDDVTKIWSHRIPKGDEKRKLTDNVKQQYNFLLRDVRDKLGAHYQQIEDSHSLFDRVELFKLIDFAQIVCLIEDIIQVESEVEGEKINLSGFGDGDDLNKAKYILKSVYSDDKANMTNGTLDVLGINKGGLISTTIEQEKAQDLKSIEVMVMIADSLYREEYAAIEAKRMFKRLYVSMIYNYHDNLITREDIKENAAQYDQGFDKLFKKLITKNDNKAMLETVFEEFEKIYHVEQVIKKHRDVRNKACAHIDEKSTVEDINCILDSLNVDDLDMAYKNMLNLFNFICKNVFCLKMLTMPPRFPLYGLQMETIKNNENFYGEKSHAEMPIEMSCTEMIRSIRQRDDRFGEAVDTLRKKLMSDSVDVYNEVIDAVSKRLRDPTISASEMTVIILKLHDARRGYPDRLQRTIVNMMNDNTIAQNCYMHLLWLLTSICMEDKGIDMPTLLDSIIKKNDIILTTLSVLAFLHLTVEKTHTCVVMNNKAHEVSDIFKEYCDSEKNPTKKCSMMLALNQHWFHGSEYFPYRTYEKKYSEYLSGEMKKALDGYFSYIKMKDENIRKICERYLETKHFVLLLFRFVLLEKELNQSTNLFMEMWKYNCFVRQNSGLYDNFGMGLMIELEGNKEHAKEIFELLVKENPINKDAIDTLENFYKRNPEMRK